MWESTFHSPYNLSSCCNCNSVRCQQGNVHIKSISKVLKPVPEQPASTFTPLNSCARTWICLASGILSSSNSGFHFIAASSNKNNNCTCGALHMGLMAGYLYLFLLGRPPETGQGRVHPAIFFHVLQHSVCGRPAIRYPLCVCIGVVNANQLTGIIAKRCAGQGSQHSFTYTSAYET